MTIEIDATEKRIIETLLSSWDKDGAPLSGDISYQDVFKLCDKLGLKHPPHIKKFCECANNTKTVDEFIAAMRG